MPDREGLNDTARVFFALWPDERVRHALDQAAAQLHKLLGGRRSRAETLHLTLVFVGTVPRERLPDLQASVAGLRVPAFDLVFDQAECWRHNRIAHLAATQPPETLMLLVEGLEGSLRQAGIRYDLRPYRAHVTLVRNADCRKEGPAGQHPAVRPICWPARDFVLMESVLRPEGAQYVELARYPLSTTETRSSPGARRVP